MEEGLEEWWRLLFDTKQEACRALRKTKMGTNELQKEFIVNEIDPDLLMEYELNKAYNLAINKLIRIIK